AACSRGGPTSSASTALCVTRSSKAARSMADRPSGAGDAPGAADRAAAKAAVVVSCEHGGRAVPDEYRALFAGAAAERLLASHRAYDDGAAGVAAALARRVGAPLFVGGTTRLLVDLNRSIGHPRLFSELTRRLSADERAELVERHYRPYRDAVERAVASAARRGPRSEERRVGKECRSRWAAEHHDH